MKTPTSTASTSAEATAVVTNPPPAPAGPPKTIISDGKVWDYIDVCGFQGYVPSRTIIPAGKPTMKWVGGKIALTLWAQILSFFEWSQKTHHSEVQVRLYYNPVARKWGVWAFPQEPNGMTTRELPDHPDTAPQRAQFPPPWVLLGTVHHHCTSSAFQSGVDERNETPQEGIHITVGAIGSAEYSIHGRIMVRGQVYGEAGVIPWDGWFDLPEAAKVLPVALHSRILDFYLKNPPPADTAFPEQWKANCHPPTRHVYTGSTGAWDAASSGRGGAAMAESMSAGRRTYIIKTDLAGQFTSKQLGFMLDAVKLMDDCKLDHNEADTLVATDTKDLNASDKLFVDAIMAAGTKYGLDEATVDQMFDQWDFSVVLSELGKDRKATPASTPELPLASTK